MSRAHWSNRMSFILAAVGSAVGLGNIWKFPYIAGLNGGGAFVLVYLLCIAAVGTPIFVAELFLGQRSQKNAVSTFDVLDKEGSKWKIIGILGGLSGFLILGFYSVVGGWILDFEAKAILNEFAGKTDGEVNAYLEALLASPLRQIFWHTVFLTGTVWIVMSGVKDGIEKWNKILMPTFFGLLVLLFVNSMFLPGFGEAVSFLFKPDFSKLSSEAILEAVGHSFFTLSLGMGAMITYGSYLDKKENLVNTAIIIGFFDTAVALVAGVVIFSIVFSNGMEPGAGPTLMFQTLPSLFTRMTGGYFIAIAFFLLVTVAAITSAVALMEVSVAYYAEHKGGDRKKASLWIGVGIFVTGILCALSTNILSDFHILGLTIFDFLDKLTSSYFLPIGGLLTSLFYGWVMGPKAVEATLECSPSWQWAAKGLLWGCRLVAPIAILVMLGNAILENLASH